MNDGQPQQEKRQGEKSTGKGASLKPLALVVFLENVGHILGVPLPQWGMDLIDYVTEEYAKALLRLLGAHRRYHRVIVLEDAQATGPELANTLLRASLTHQVDLLLLVHGLEGALVGFKNRELVDGATFQPLVAAYQHNPALLDLRMVYGVNCYGASLAPTWLSLGALAVNGAAGVNWLPEPSLSVFLRAWLSGTPYSQAVARSHRAARRVGRLLWPPDAQGRDHPCIASSQQMVFGRRDLTIFDRG